MKLSFPFLDDFHYKLCSKNAIKQASHTDRQREKDAFLLFSHHDLLLTDHPQAWPSTIYIAKSTSLTKQWSSSSSSSSACPLFFLIFLLFYGHYCIKEMKEAAAEEENRFPFYVLTCFSSFH